MITLATVTFYQTSINKFFKQDKLYVFYKCNYQQDAFANYHDIPHLLIFCTNITIVRNLIGCLYDLYIFLKDIIVILKC